MTWYLLLSVAGAYLWVWPFSWKVRLTLTPILMALLYSPIVFALLPYSKPHTPEQLEELHKIHTALQKCREEQRELCLKKGYEITSAEDGRASESSLSKLIIWEFFTKHTEMDAIYNSIPDDQLRDWKVGNGFPFGCPDAKPSQYALTCGDTKKS